MVLHFVSFLSFPHVKKNVPSEFSKLIVVRQIQPLTPALDASCV